MFVVEVKGAAHRNMYIKQLKFDKYENRYLGLN
jgi:hypothetical protein